MAQEWLGVALNSKYLRGTRHRGELDRGLSDLAVSSKHQNNVALANTRVIVLEAMADNAHPKANDIYATLPAGLVVMEDDDTA